LCDAARPDRAAGGDRQDRAPQGNLVEMSLRLFNLRKSETFAIGCGDITATNAPVRYVRKFVNFAGKRRRVRRPVSSQSDLRMPGAFRTALLVMESEPKASAPPQSGPPHPTCRQVDHAPGMIFGMPGAFQT
jgi:hypothetical protein